MKIIEKCDGYRAFGNGRFGTRAPVRELRECSRCAARTVLCFAMSASQNWGVVRRIRRRKPDIGENRHRGFVSLLISCQSDRANGMRFENVRGPRALPTVRRLDARDEPHGHQRSDREGPTRSRHKHGEPDAPSRLPGKDHLPTWLERLGPCCRRRDDSGINVNQIGGGNGRGSRVDMHHRNILERLQVCPRAAGKVFIDLERVRAATRAWRDAPALVSRSALVRIGARRLPCR